MIIGLQPFTEQNHNGNPRFFGLFRHGRAYLEERIFRSGIYGQNCRSNFQYGWIRFNGFIPPVHKLLRAALTDLRDTQALIIDIDSQLMAAIKYLKNAIKKG
jgi:hypothetical protein